MKRKRTLTPLLLALVLVVTLADPLLAQDPIKPLPKGGSTRPGQSVLDLMWAVRDVISGPGWLMAYGIDPRLLIDRPGWDTLTRLGWEKLGSPLSSGDQSPVLQAAGPGVLVPYRDPAPAFSRDLLVTRDFGGQPMQTEPHIAVNPRDPDHLLLGTIDYSFPNVSAYVSIDGGVTWDGPRQIKYQRDDRVGGGDPVVAFDRGGKAYFCSISLGLEEYSIGPAVGMAMVSSIQVATSPDGGFTWEEPVSTARSGTATEDITTDLEGRVRGRIHLSFLDKPWMAIGPHPAEPDQDVIYLTYTDFVMKYDILYIGEVPVLGAPDMETTIRLVRSDDGGMSWTDPVAVSPTVQRVYGEVSPPGEVGPVASIKRVVQGSQVGVGPDGHLYVVWLDSTDDDTQKGLAELYVAGSDDGGETFGEPERVATFLEPGFRPRNAFFRYWGAAFPQMAVGPDGEVFLAYTALPPDKPIDEGDIYMVRSRNGGENWTQPVRLNQDDTDRLQFFPAIDVGPDGVIHAMWGDMRQDPVETRYHIYYTRSQDGGQTWGFEAPELDLKVGDARVTDYPSNPNRGFPYGLFIGDYFAIAAVEEDAYLVWADTRLGEFGPTNQKIGFSRRRPIPAPELFLSPAAGPGGQSVTVQGHNFQPDMNVFLQMADTTVASGRTNPEGRISMELFVPISGEGGHRVQLVDESGNAASSSFYMDFGFNNVRDLGDQLQGLDQKLDGLSAGTGPGVPPDVLRNLEQELGRLRDIEQEIQQLRQLVEGGAAGEPAGPVEPARQQAARPVPLWLWGLAGLAGLALGAGVAWVATSRRRGKG